MGLRQGEKIHIFLPLFLGWTTWHLAALLPRARQAPYAINAAQ